MAPIQPDDDLVLHPGRGQLRLTGTLHRGRILPGARVALWVEDLVAEQAEWSMAAERLAAWAESDGESIALTIHGWGEAKVAAGTVQVEALTLTADLPLANPFAPPGRPTALLEVAASAPLSGDLAAQGGRLSLTRGRAFLRAQLRLGRDGHLVGELSAQAEELSARFENTLFEGTARAEASLRGDLDARSLHAAAGDLTLDGQIGDAEAALEPWRLDARLEHAEGNGARGRARAAISVGSLRPLAASLPPDQPALSRSIAALQDVHAAVAARWRPTGLTLTLIHARAGAAWACGSWRFEEAGRTGAALVEIGRDAWGLSTGHGGDAVTRRPDAAWRSRYLEPKTRDGHERLAALEGPRP